MRPYVSEVSFNIQGGGKIALGPKTLICGPNRIGKSSIVRAIELALSGRASDIAGRDTLALDADLWALAGDGVAIAECTARLDDGSSGTWSLQRGKKAKRTGIMALFPLRDVRGAILGSAETARKFFLGVAATISWDAVLAEFPDQFREKLAPYKASDGATGLLAAIDGLKKRVRDLNAQAKAQRENASLNSQGLPPPPSEKEIAAAKAAEKTVHVANARSQIRDLEAERARASDRAQTLRGAIAELQSAMPPPSRLPDVVAHALAVGEYHAAHNSTTCAVCGTKNLAPSTFAERVAYAKNLVAEALARADQSVAIERKIKGLEGDIQMAERDVERYNREIATLQGIVGDAPEAPAAAGKDYAALVAAAAKWEAIRHAEGRAVELEAEATNAGKIVTLAQTVLARLVEKSREDFQRRVQAFLPADLRFGIELRDGDREVLRVGVYRWPVLEEPGILSTAASGAEWSAMTAALAAACLPAGNAPAVIVPEDRDFDPEMLAAVMESFSKIDAQVIITAAKKPAHDVEGWTVVDLGKDHGADYCRECGSWISIGECPHGVKGHPVSRDVEGDIFFFAGR